MKKHKFYITCKHGKDIEVMQREGEILELARNKKVASVLKKYKDGRKIKNDM
jgi:hypothetical protein